MKYSVVITTYNRIELLKECVRQVLAQTIPFEHIIIINNASTDETKAFLSGLSRTYRQVHCKSLLHNTGGAGGFYEGVKEALCYDNDYLLFIDDDAMINTNYIEEIDAAVRQYGDVCKAFSGTVMTNGRINYLHRYFLASSLFFKMKPVEKEYYEGKIFQYDLSTFCGLVLNMDIINKIGLPDKEFFISYDDTEYCLRVMKHTPVINVNSARLNHKEKASTADIFNWKRYYGYRNKIILGMQYTKWKPMYAIKMAVWHILRILKCGYRYLINESREDQGDNIVQHFDAWYDGVRGRCGIRDKYLPKK